MIIAREKEIKVLRSTLTSSKSEFVAVYGRRRVGKTFLIREAFSNKFTFQHAGIHGENRETQLAAFCRSLQAAGLKETGKPRNWIEAFELLKEVVQRSRAAKKVLFIDELSWVYTHRSDLIAALESFWNGWASARKDVVLVVCASATSWMVNKIVHNRGGLYNRLTEQIWLQPFCLGECEQYVKAQHLALERDQIVEMYMIAGGVPYYWSLLKREESLPQNIDRIFFAPDAPLRHEYEYLYSSLFEQPDSYLRVVKILGNHKEGLTFSEIQHEIGGSQGGTLTHVLADLEYCGFVRSFKSFGNKKRGANYQLIDNFSLFYFKFLASNPTDPHYWSHRYNAPGTNSWRGLAFERVGLWHIPQLKKALGISGIYTEYSAWKCKANEQEGIAGAQIDLIIDRADKMVTICEMKYYNKVYAMTKKDGEALRAKVSSFRRVTRTSKGVSLAMVTMHGVTRNAYSSSVDVSITCNDIFTIV